MVVVYVLQKCQKYGVPATLILSHFVGNYLPSIADLRYIVRP